MPPFSSAFPHTNVSRKSWPYRTGVTSPDKLSVPAAPTTANASSAAGSLVFNTTYYAAVAAGNRYGTTPSGTPASILVTNDSVSTHVIDLAIAQVTGPGSAVAEWYDIFLAISSTGPLWVGRITEAQRAAGGYSITAVGTVGLSGSAAAGHVWVNLVGTGVAANAVPFITFNTAYVPAGVLAINCSGYSIAHIHTKLIITDLRATSLPTLSILPFLQDENTQDFYQCQFITEALLGADGQPLLQDYIVNVDGSTGLVVCVSAISGQGAAATITIETA